MRNFVVTSIMMMLVTSCGSVPLTSMWKLVNLDFLTVDPAQIRVAVVMPDTLRVQEDGAVIITGIEKSKRGPAVEERFILQKSIESLSPGVANYPGLDYEAFKIAPADVPRLRALQDKIRQLKSKYPNDANGFLSVSAAGCSIAALPQGALLVTTLIKTRNDQAFFILTKDVDLRSIAPKDKLEMEVPLCPKEIPGQ